MAPATVKPEPPSSVEAGSAAWPRAAPAERMVLGPTCAEHRSPRASGFGNRPGRHNLCRIRTWISRTGAFVAHTARAVRIVVGHGGIPRPIRWLAAVGLLPIPGPFDEAVLLVVALILFAFYRTELRKAWHESAAPRRDPPSK